jgi:hypothetical protein
MADIQVSTSPDRYTFQSYSHTGQYQQQDLQRFHDPVWCQDNLEYDLRTTSWILQKVRDSRSYAQNLYAAMCNNEFQKMAVMPILTDRTWHCSWRHAGGIVAHMRESGDYIDWYCSGMTHAEVTHGMPHTAVGFVPECTVTAEIAEDLHTLGWRIILS